MPGRVVKWAEALPTLTDKVYYGSYGEYMSVSLLKKYVEDPEGFKQFIEDRDAHEEPNDALIFGRLVHCDLFEGKDEVYRQFTHVHSDNYPEMLNSKSGKPYGRKTKKRRQWEEHYQLNKWNTISTDELERSDKIVTAVCSNDEAREWISSCDKVELPLRGVLRDVKFQGKLDACNDAGRIVDLKTMRPDTEAMFEMYDRKYHWQAYCYMNLYAVAYGLDVSDVAFKFVFATKEEDPKVSVITVDNECEYYRLAEQGVTYALEGLKYAELHDNPAFTFFFF